jgi:hypothetical protein
MNRFFLFCLLAVPGVSHGLGPAAGYALPLEERSGPSCRDSGAAPKNRSLWHPWPVSGGHCADVGRGGVERTAADLPSGRGECSWNFDDENRAKFPPARGVFISERWFVYVGRFVSLGRSVLAPGGVQCRFLSVCLA